MLVPLARSGISISVVKSSYVSVNPSRFVGAIPARLQRYSFRKRLFPKAEATESSRKHRIPIMILLDAAVWFLLRFFTIVVLGVPLQSILKHPKSMDAPWVWSFWFRLPIVVGIGYAIFPWWSASCNRIFSPSNDLASAISTVLAPLTTLLYAALAGYAVVSLWGRLEKVRSSLHKEFALLEILEKRIPEDRSGTPAPSRFNHLAELAAAPALADGVAQQQIQSIAQASITVASQQETSKKTK
eukprot:Skav215775  [mRNA]  locus=scaffold2278:98337:99540:+ [translate_table: standard]